MKIDITKPQPCPACGRQVALHRSPHYENGGCVCVWYGCSACRYDAPIAAYPEYNKALQSHNRLSLRARLGEVTVSAFSLLRLLFNTENGYAFNTHYKEVQDCLEEQDAIFDALEELKEQQ